MQKSYITVQKLIRIRVKRPLVKHISTDTTQELLSLESANKVHGENEASENHLAGRERWEN